MASNRRALVTGASSGIGEAFARELARRGHDLVLTARRADRLETLAAELRDRHGVDAIVAPLDLSRVDGPEALVAALDAQHLHIDVLINNAGYAVPGFFDEASWEAQAAFIQVLMTAPTELAYRLLPGMKARGYGRIVNVASLAAHIPGSAGHTLYGASKAYLVKFSQSLALETRGTGVHVTGLCPGFTYSEFHDVTGSRAMVSKMPSHLWMDAVTVAKQGMDAVEAGKAIYVNGKVNTAIKILFKLLPDALALKMVERQSHRFRVGRDGGHP
ncbi:SDR family oxidoreductase [Luteibacter anthropi]|uniref:SDR family NAD(P)-dependent oxidoreductase n=1 Tax=Luteibacter anthropi TaxID=564369 RepID=UPI002032C7A8|nr:SDR family oxidoreductase [Luteibacter anthropi]URX63150.1 SDR family oxidoreductase [Luteibacter anthropi]